MRPEHDPTTRPDPHARLAEAALEADERRPVLAQLPHLTAAELDELAIAVELRLIALGSILGTAFSDAVRSEVNGRWLMCQSLETAIAEARASLR